MLKTSFRFLDLIPSGVLPLLFLTFPYLVGCSKPLDEFERDGGRVYLNTARWVKYVGSDKCTPCHQSIARSYAEAEMGRSMTVLDPTNVLEEFPQKEAVYDSVKHFFYEMRREGNRFYQREYRLDKKGKVIHERTVEAQYVMGSGNNLRMYFHDENGMLYELPLTWYVHKKRWDLSPGYREFGNLRFSRYATAKCISCHNSYLEESKTALDRYKRPFPFGIGCERCHGPGELHVREMRGEKLTGFPKNAETIVNPAKLSPERQLDVCRQCHLQGKAWALQSGRDWFDYRPGMLLKSHRSVYFPEATLKEVFEVADSPHRLGLSACFKKSGGTLTCLTCHDPHRSIKSFSVQEYNDKCQTCHVPQKLPGPGTRHRHERGDNCVSCHMNQTGTDNTLHGVSNTDHWIRVDANQTVIDWTTLKRPPSEQPPITLVPDIDARDDEILIRRGIAYLDYYRQHDRRRLYLDSALSFLSQGVSRAKESARGFSYLGEVRFELGQSKEAIAAFTRALSLRPEDSEFSALLASVYSASGDYHSAIRYFRSALEKKPDEPRYLEGLGMALADAGFTDEAMEVLQRGLRIDRHNPYTYYTLGNIYIQHLKQPEKAIPFYRELVTLDPDFPNGYLNLANSYAVLKRYDEALKYYDREILVRPNSPLGYFNQGRVYFLMGRKVQAREAFQKTLEIDPTIEPAKQYLEQLKK